MRSSQSLAHAGLSCRSIVPFFAFALFLAAHPGVLADPVDVVPFGIPLPEGNGVMWEDPREIHRVVAEFEGAAPPADKVHLEYWGSWWPERHLPKDREPGGGDMGWMELGNWYKYAWRKADAETTVEGNRCTFTFRPVNAKEFPKLTKYPAPFRYTLKIRLTSESPLPRLRKIEAFTDSQWADRSIRIVLEKPGEVAIEAFNGEVRKLEKESPQAYVAQLRITANPDPNTFDRTLATIRQGNTAFTVAVDELQKGPLFVPVYGAAVLPGDDRRDFAALAQAQQGAKQKTLYDRVTEMPEQTWRAAWDSMPPKKSPIYLPLGLDGGRQRFRLDPDGSLSFRSNDRYLKQRPGKDTPRLDWEKPRVRVGFGLPGHPVARSLEEASFPLCHTSWQLDGTLVQQTAFVTVLEGAKGQGPVPAGDATAVFMARFTFSNNTNVPTVAVLPLTYKVGDADAKLRVDATGKVWLDDRLRAQMVVESNAVFNTEALRWSWALAPGETRTAVVKWPYVVLSEPGEEAALSRLRFDQEQAQVAAYWRRRLAESARLITPEPMLNEFYRAHAGHLLINCEREPNSDRRFARVGSFSYGAYGNESCMMVVDLERRGYHKEAQDCLDGWLHYQGTVALPGDFASKEGVLYGAGGYEAGGYNQHHGWILWMVAEHFRFTRDTAWLQRAVPGILAGANWIIRETARTADRHPLERGLLPAGSLEDIGDWWTWLSTSCYTWRGLDAAAWALEQLRHPEAARIRQQATAYHTALLANFRQAAQRAPVVRLRDGTAVPKFPSHVHRRGRSFGWICETLEGSIHLIITRAIDPRSAEAEWIIKDYEDNLYLSNQWGYTLDDFERWWFGRGGMSMQACLLLDVEPYLYRDDIKHALRAMFNAQAVSYFPDVRLNTEHALPDMGDWRGDHYKSSDESNIAGWLRYLFVREEDEVLLLGQAVPREWLQLGKRCGIQRTATHFGPASVFYVGGPDEITAHIDGPQRNPPRTIKLRFREPRQRAIRSVTVNGKEWKRFQGDWVELPGDTGRASVVARFIE